MNFTNEEFSAFERDLKAATIALCSKYEVKLKKMKLSYGPDSANTWIKCVNGIAVEDNFLAVFTSKEAIERHLDELYAEGVMEGTVPIVSYQFEDIIRIADEKQLSVLFDIDDELNRGYYSYDCDSKNMKVVIMTKRN